MFFVLNRSIIVLLKRVKILIKIQNKYMNFSAPSFNQVPTIKKLGELEIIDRPEIKNLPPYPQTEIVKVLQSLNNKMFA